MRCAWCTLKPPTAARLKQSILLARLAAEKVQPA
jgi:hypothetical protein